MIYTYMYAVIGDPHRSLLPVLPTNNPPPLCTTEDADGGGEHLHGLLEIKDTQRPGTLWWG